MLKAVVHIPYIGNGDARFYQDMALWYNRRQVYPALTSRAIQGHVLNPGPGPRSIHTRRNHGHGRSPEALQAVLQQVGDALEGGRQVRTRRLLRQQPQELHHGKSHRRTDHLCEVQEVLGFRV